MGVKVKNRNGAWWVFINHHGQRKAKKVGTEKAAREVASMLQGRLALGDFSCLQKTVPKAKEPTFAEYAQQWRDLNPNSCKHSTIEYYRDFQERYINPRFGARKLSSISRGEIKMLLAELGQKKLARNTIRLALASLRAVLTTAVEDGVISSNPASRLGRFTTSEKKAHEAQSMEPDEVQAFLDAARAYCPDYYPLFLIAVRAGLRQGEILALKWGDIQFGKDENDQNRFLVVQRRWYRGAFSTPKGGKTRRVDMSRELRKALLDTRDARLLEAFAQGHDNISDDLLFPGATGGHPVSVRTLVESYYQPVLEKAGLRRFRFHDLRHTFGSLLIQSGAPLPYVSEQMGHASIQITADIYVHLIPGRNVGWVDRLDTPTAAQPDATQTQPESVTEEDQHMQISGEVVEEKAWCERGESNPHGFPRQILSLVRLPIPPLSQHINYTDAGFH